MISFSIMAYCLLLESDSPEFEFQFQPWLIVRRQAGFFTSLCQTSHNKISLIAVSTSQSGYEDNTWKSLGVSTK